MLSYTEHDNAQAVEIVLKGRVSTEEFDRIAGKLEAFIARHGKIRVLEMIEDFEGMDAIAFWHDVKFSLRHLHDFSRLAIVTNPDMPIFVFSPTDVEAIIEYLNSIQDRPSPTEPIDQ